MLIKRYIFLLFATVLFLMLVGCSTNRVAFYQYKNDGVVLDNLTFSESGRLSFDQLGRESAVKYCPQSSEFYCLLAQGSSIALALPKKKSVKNHWSFRDGVYTYARIDNKYIQLLPEKLINSYYSYVLEYSSDKKELNHIYILDNQAGELEGIAFLYASSGLHLYELSRNSGLKYTESDIRNFVDIGAEPEFIDF